MCLILTFASPVPSARLYSALFLGCVHSALIYTRTSVKLNVSFCIPKAENILLLEAAVRIYCCISSAMLLVLQRKLFDPHRQRATERLHFFLTVFFHVSVQFNTSSMTINASAARTNIFTYMVINSPYFTDH